MDTLRIVFDIRYTYQINATLHKLRQLPLIGRHIPYGLYDNRDLKALITLLSMISYVLKAIFRKVVYFGIMVFFPTLLFSRLSALQMVQSVAAGQDWGDILTGWFSGVFNHSADAAVMNHSANIYVHILFFLCLIGALLSQHFLDATQERYYAVILMRMDAKRYELIDYGVFLIETAAGYLIVGTLFGVLAHMPVWMGILAGCSMAGIKVLAAAWTLHRYPKTERTNVGGIKGSTQLILVLTLFAAAYVPAALQHPIPYPVLAVVMAALALGGLLNVKLLFDFSDYREICQRLSWQVLHPEVEEAAAVNSRSMISADTTLNSDKNGFEYLNELFVKRHKKLLWRRSLITASVLGIIVAAMILFCLVNTDARKGINRMLLNSFPIIIFVMYLINTGSGYTQALFVNCDHSLLTYPMFKQPDAILKLFWIRLRGVIKVNLLPAVVIGVGMAVLLFLSGGAGNLLYYVVLIVGTISMSLFFSVHYLTLYYLLQPYTAGTEMKSPVYGAITGLTYAFCYSIDRLQMDTLLFGAVMTGLCLLYCAVAGVLVYWLAPKTFRIRN